MMKTEIPNTADHTAIEAFFADLGISVEVVDRCPDAGCERCGKTLDEAA